jgi:hypothetical protein
MDDLDPIETLYENLSSAASRPNDYSGEPFWTLPALRRVLNLEETSRVLGLRLDYRDSTNTTLAKRVHDRSIRIFAILVMIEAAEAIFDFIENDVKDDDLPIPDTILLGGKDEIPLRFSFIRRWSRTRRALFFQRQWQVLTPVFTYQEVPVHYSFDHRVILPWIKKESRAAGAFDVIQRVTIDPDSYHFASPKVSTSI